MVLTTQLAFPSAKEQSANTKQSHSHRFWYDLEVFNGDRICSTVAIKLPYTYISNILRARAPIKSSTARRSDYQSRGNIRNCRAVRCSSIKNGLKVSNRSRVF